MKQLLIVFLIIVPCLVCSQDLETVFKSKGIEYSDIEDKTTFLDLGDKNIDQYDEEDNVFKTISTESFWNILNLNLLEYYNLSDRYDTELKIKKYKETDNYGQKLKKIKKLKKELKNSIISTRLDYDALSNYDLDRNAFVIELGNSDLYSYDIKTEKTGLDGNEYQDRPPKTIYNVSIEYLNIERIVSSKSFNKVFYKEIILAQTNENRALKIENHKSDVDVYLIFDIKSEKMKEFKEEWDESGDNQSSTINTRVFYPSFIRLIMVNSDNGQIYFDKLYDPTGSKNMITLDDTLQKQESKEHSHHQDKENDEALFPGVKSDKNKESKGNDALFNGNKVTHKDDDTLNKYNSEIAHSLEGRSLEKVPEMKNDSHESGKVVLNFKVDKKGNIKYVEYTLKGSTTQKLHLIQWAKQAARKAKFNKTHNAPEEQWGKMTFSFE